MKKIMMGLCFICALSFAREETEEYEIDINEIETEEERETRPLFIEVTISNIQDANSSSKTIVYQNQEAVIEEAKNIEKKNRSLSATEIALLLLLLNQEDEPDAWGAQW